MSTPLTDRINALTAYSNQKTGASDTTLSDAVTRLVSGYGGGSSGYGSEVEQGVFTATADSFPTISFTNTHNAPPDIVLLQDVSDTFPTNGNTGLLFIYINNTAVFGKAFANTASTTWDDMYLYGRTSASLSFTGGAAQYTRGNVKSDSFEPYFGSGAIFCRTGQTYKWIAIWK